MGAKELFTLHKELSKNMSCQDIFDSAKTLSSKYDSYNVLSTYLSSEVELYEFIGISYQKLKELENFQNTNRRKHLGIYFTDYSIARLMAKSLILQNTKPIEETSFFEPSVGGGIFVIAYVDELIEQYPEILVDGRINVIVKNIYVSDVDDDVINLIKEIIPQYIKNKYDINIRIPSSNFYSGNILFQTNVLGGYNKNDPKDIFNRNEGFDLILSNPPYKLLKANSNKYDSEGFVENKVLLESIRKNNFYYLNQGTLNLYKIFIEEILESYLSQTGILSAIIPSSILRDKQSEKLRVHMIENYSLGKIYLIPEKNEFFPDITQSFCFFDISKQKKSGVQTSEIVPGVINSSSFSNRPIKFSGTDLKKISTSMPIVGIQENEWKLLKKISSYPKIKDIGNVVNLRGELDLTLDKKYINSASSIPLLKGDKIKPFKHLEPTLYVDEKFFKDRGAKEKYTKTMRIACQQISNMSQNHRLKFSLVKPNTVLANSCNFIALSETYNNSEVSILYLLGILNSRILNWRFKVSNANNHISNYEIDELPIPIPNTQQRILIEKMVEKMLNEPNESIYHKLNEEVSKIYNLSEYELEIIK